MRVVSLTFLLAEILVMIFVIENRPQKSIKWLGSYFDIVPCYIRIANLHFMEIFFKQSDVSLTGAFLGVIQFS